MEDSKATPDAPVLDAASLHVLACPKDYSRLHASDGALVCDQGHRFSVEQGIPVFTAHPRRESEPGNMKPCVVRGKETGIDPFVNDWLVNTNGNLYWRVRGRLPRYPIPVWRFEKGHGRRLLDLGCSWGRWTIAAARAGFHPIGLDVHMDALAAASRVARQLGARADFVCGDAEDLPFPSGSIEAVFSYSVLQHLDKDKVLRVLREVARILTPQGVCFIQLPNTWGPYNILRQLKRGFREAKPGTFEMRYWSRAEIRRATEQAGMDLLAVRADGFFSQNPQISDLDLLSVAGKLVVLVSHVGCRAAAALPALTWVADSLWVEAQKPNRLP